MVESIYFLKPAWCGTPCAGLWPEQGLQPVRKAFAFRRWFVTREIPTDLPSMCCLKASKACIKFEWASLASRVRRTIAGIRCLNEKLDERGLQNKWHSHPLSENRWVEAPAGSTPWIGWERSVLDSFGTRSQSRIRHRDAGRERTRKFEHTAQRVSVPGSRKRCRRTHPGAPAGGSGPAGPLDGRHDRGFGRESNGYLHSRSRP